MSNYEVGANSNAEPFGGDTGGVAEHDSAVATEEQGGQDAAATGDTTTATDGQAGDLTQQQSATTSGANGASTPVWDGKQWTLRFRGKEVVPKTREELMNWASFGYSQNTRKQQLDKREQELAGLGKELDQVRQINQLFEQVPDFKRQVFEIYNRYNSGMVQPGQPQQQQQGSQQEVPDAVRPYVEPLQSKITQLEEVISGLQSRFTVQDEREADKGVQEEIGKLKTSYADEDWQTKDEEGHDLLYDILKHAHDNGFKTLEAAYRDLRWEAREANVRAKALQEAQEKQQQAQKAGFVGKGGGTKPAEAPVQARPNYRNMSWSQIAQEAAKQLKD